MYQILITCREAAIASIPLIPLYVILYLYYFHDIKRSIFCFLFSLYLAAMYAAVGLPDITYYRFSPRYNFVPFLYMFTAWDTSLLNVILFLPLGFFLPILWSNMNSFIKTAGFGLCISIFIEILQIFTFRATDINDIMTNTFGTCIGFLLGSTALKKFPAFAPVEGRGDFPIVMGSALAVMFFIYPFIVPILQ